MLRFCTLASGSSGNASLVSCGETHILLDMGISVRELSGDLRALGLSVSDLDSVFITHAHWDHIKGLGTLSKKYTVPVRATHATCGQIDYRIPFFSENMCPFEDGAEIAVGTLRVRTFPTSHDCAGSVGYIVSGEDGTVVLCTDLGIVTDEVKSAARQADILVCECNHDEEMLVSGHYPFHLKKRILGDHGHLSNDSGAALAAEAAKAGAKALILGHLSKENNLPELALEAVRKAMEEAGCLDQVSISAAPRSKPGPVFCLEKGKVWQERGGF